VRTRLLGADIAYTGAQLRSGWIERTAGLVGDALVAFFGPCDVAPEHMVDRVDLESGARICSPRMLHLIVEHPGLGLHEITCRQRLLMALAGELINAHLGETLLHRDGDDLYLRDRKLSISVATTSPRSGLLHSAFNLRGEGAPVPAVGLAELGLDPRPFAERLLSAYSEEVDGIIRAAAKVKPVP
jgi:hypothetical protein